MLSKLNMKSSISIKSFSSGLAPIREFTVSFIRLKPLYPINSATSTPAIPSNGKLLYLDRIKDNSTVVVASMSAMLSRSTASIFFDVIIVFSFLLNKAIQSFTSMDTTSIITATMSNFTDSGLRILAPEERISS